MGTPKFLFVIYWRLMLGFTEAHTKTKEDTMGVYMTAHKNTLYVHTICVQNDIKLKLNYIKTLWCGLSKVLINTHF